MEQFGQLLATISPFLAIAIVAAGLKSVQILPVPAVLGPALNSIVMNVTLPATVFLVVRKARGQQIGTTEWLITLTALLVICASALVAFLVSRYWLHLPRRTEGTFVLVTMFGSTASVALPIIQVLYPSGDTGAKATLDALFYSEIGTLLPLVTIAILIASIYGEAEEGKQFGWRSLLAIPRSAPFIWLAIGMLFFTDDIPSGVTGFLSVLSQANAPLVFLALGLTIEWRDVGRLFRPLLTLNVIKLLLAPVLGLLIGALLGVSGVSRNVVVVESAVPAVLLGIAYANQYKLDVEFASTAVFSSFIFSIITLPIMATLLGVR
jgi:predicted permease